MCLKRLDPLLETGQVADWAAVHEHDEHGGANQQHNSALAKRVFLIANGVQMAHPYSQNLLMLLSEFHQVRNRKAWKMTGPCLVSEGISYKCGRPEELKHVKRLCGSLFQTPLSHHCKPFTVVPVHHFESQLFYPYHHTEKGQMTSCGQSIDKSYTIQHWSSTHHDYVSHGVAFKHGTTWLLEERAATYSGNWTRGKCIGNGQFAHPTTSSEESSVTYTLNPPLPEGTIIHLDKITKVGIDGGSPYALGNYPVASPVQTLTLYGASPHVRVTRQDKNMLFFKSASQISYTAPSSVPSRRPTKAPSSMPSRRPTKASGS